MGLRVWGLGLKAEGSRFRLQGFSGSGRRALGTLQVVGAGARAVTAQTKADKANGHSIYYQRQFSELPFYQANGRFMKPRQPVNNFARRPFYRSVVLPVDHFIAPNGRFIKANKRFYQAKAGRRPFYHP